MFRHLNVSKLQIISAVAGVPCLPRRHPADAQVCPLHQPEEETRDKAMRGGRVTGGYKVVLFFCQLCRQRKRLPDFVLYIYIFFFFLKASGLYGTKQ